MNQLQEKFKELNRQEFSIFKRSSGLPTEFDTDMNDISRKKIEIFAAIHNNEKCYLGKVNRYSEDEGNPGLVPYDGQQVFNFEYGFMIPAYDAKLINLIMDRDEAEYTGTKEDFVMVEAIMNRIAELGGINLFWV